MGRPLPLQIIGLLPTTPLTLFIVLCVFTVVSFLCGSHRGLVKSIRGKEEKKTVRLGGENKKRVIDRMKSSLSSKALVMSKMISWRKVQDGNEEEEVEEEEVGEDSVVWKKTIIKGEKCRPLDFSGKILYDSNGNLLAD